MEPDLRGEDSIDMLQVAEHDAAQYSAATGETLGGRVVTCILMTALTPSLRAHTAVARSRCHAYICGSTGVPLVEYQLSKRFRNPSQHANDDPMEVDSDKGKGQVQEQMEGETYPHKSVKV